MNARHGSARLGTEEQLRESGLLGGRGIYVGMWENKRKEMLPIQDGDLEPTLLIGPTGSGKDVGGVMPNLLSWLGSLLVLDPKREGWEKSAGWRAAQGQQCVQIDPTCTTGAAACWNPLHEIPPPPRDVAFVQTLAAAGLAPEEYTRNDATAEHFRQHGENFLAALLLYIVYYLPDKSFRGGLEFLTSSARTIEETLTVMIQTGHHFIANAARAVLSTGPNERGSIISTARTFFLLYYDPTIAQNTSTSDFTIADVLRENVSVYITIPTPSVDRLKPFIRMLFYQLLAALTVQPRPADHPFLFLLNEFPLLGHMRPLAEILPVVRSYGLKFVLPAQDLNQIYRTYGQQESLTGNCKVNIFFRPQPLDLDTARAVSAACGQTTVYMQERTYTGQRWDWVLTHVIANERQVQRPLLTPDEILRLGDEEQLLLYKGVPYVAQKIRYYNDVGFLTRSQIPPPHRSATWIHTAGTQTGSPWFLATNP